MAEVLEKDNPFDVYDITRRHVVSKNVTILEWLQSRFGENFTEHSHPTVCLHNGKAVLRKDWETRLIERTDVVIFQRVAGDPVTIIALVVAAFSVYTALSIDIPTQERGDKADDVFSLNAQQNQYKLGQPIEVLCGKPLHYPSFAAQTYTQYIGNEQWQFQLFSITVGPFAPDITQIEDTLIGNFSEVEHAYYQPGETPTLFPTGVVTSSEVGNILLEGTNAPGWDWSGPFAVNAAGSQIDRIEVDFILPSGLYGAPEGSGINNAQCNLDFEYQEINDSGTAIGSWIRLDNWERILSTTKTQRVTLGKNVTPGRYQVRAHKYSLDHPDTNHGSNEAYWTGLRGFLETTNDYGNVTLLAVKAKATNNLNDKASTRINVRGTAMVPIWDGSAWSAPQATRNPIWHFLDLWRNPDKGPGLGLSDDHFNLPNYKALADAADVRGDTIDYVFNQRSNTWDAGTLIGRTIRSRPITLGSKIALIRDELKTLHAGVFNQHNIVPGTFESQLVLENEGDHDGFEIEYLDETTGKQETVPCLVGTDTGYNPKNVKLPGVIQRRQAFQEGMYLRGCEKYHTENITFTTEMEGRLLAYLDLISVNYDLLDTEQSGNIVSISGTTIELAEPVVFDLPDIHAIYLRKKDGTAFGPFNVTAGAHSKQIILASPIDTTDLFQEADSNYDPAQFQFGKLNNITTDCTVLETLPQSDGTTKIRAVVSDPRVHTYGILPTPALNAGQSVTSDPLPAITNLVVNPDGASPKNTQASWDANPSARYYTVEVSNDDENWDFVGNVVENSIQISTPFSASYYVRVAAVNKGRGAWATWAGTIGTVEPPRTLALASGTAYLVKKGDGTIISQLHVTFDPSITPSAAAYEVQYATAAEYATDDWTNAGSVGGSFNGYNISNVEDGVAYHVRLRAVVGELLKSAWVEVGPHTIVGKTAPPVTPTGLAAVAQVNGVRLTCNRTTEADFSKYLVYANTSNSKPVDPDYTSADNIKTITGLVAGQAYYFWLEAVDTSGNKSTATASVTATPLSVSAGETGAPAINYIGSPRVLPVAYDYSDYTPSSHTVDTVLLVGGQQKTYAAIAQNDRWRYNSLVYTGGSAATIGSAGEIGFSSVSSFPIQTIVGEIVYRDSTGTDFPIPFETSFQQVASGVGALNVILSDYSFRANYAGTLIESINNGDQTIVVSLGNANKTYAATAQNDRWRIANVSVTNVVRDVGLALPSIGISDITDDVGSMSFDVIYRDFEGTDETVSVNINYKRVRAGAPALTATNYSTNLPSLSDGTSVDYTAAKWTPSVYFAGSARTYSPSAQNDRWRYDSFAVVSSTRDTGLTSPEIGVSAISADTGKLIATIIYRDSEGIDHTTTAVGTFTKAKQGDTGDTGATGQTRVWVFKAYSTGIPTTPTGNGTPSGWVDERGATGQIWWQSYSMQYDDGTLASGWSTPVRVPGNVTFSSIDKSTIPSAILIIGDVAYDSQNLNTPYVWNGSAWDANGIVSLTASKITTGTLTSVGITMAGTSVIKAGQTAFDTGVGYWLGLDSGTPKFSIGNGSDKGLSWNGTACTVRGEFYAGSTSPTAGNFYSKLTPSEITLESLNGKVSLFDSYLRIETKDTYPDHVYISGDHIRMTSGDITAEAHLYYDRLELDNGIGGYTRYKKGSIEYETGGTLRSGLTFGTSSIIAQGTNTYIRSNHLRTDNSIYFGTELDTNLYRSAANTLKTDDTFHVAGGCYSNAFYDLDDSTYYLNPSSSGTAFNIKGKAVIGDAVPGENLDTAAIVQIRGNEATLQLSADNGGSAGAKITLTNESKHWQINNAPSDNRLEFRYGTTTGTADVFSNTSTVMELDPDGTIYVNGTALGTITEQAAVSDLAFPTLSSTGGADALSIGSASTAFGDFRNKINTLIARLEAAGVITT